MNRADAMGAKSSPVGEDCKETELGSRELAVRVQVISVGSVECRTQRVAERGLKLRFLMSMRAGRRSASAKSWTL